MISIDRAIVVERAKALVRKGAAWVADVVAKARATRFVRKFSWWAAFRFVVLTTALIGVGLLVGAMTVALPPAFALGTAVLPVIFLIWATPELRRVPIKSLTRVFYIFIVVHACIPYYYAISLPGAPLLTIRRITVYTLLALFCITIAGSGEMRRRIAEAIKINRALSICIIGYVAMCFISLSTATYPELAMSQIAEFSFNWFVPAMTCLIVVQTMDDVRGVLKLIAYCFFFVTFVGVIDFIGERNYLIEIMPKALVERMIEAYPVFLELVNMHSIRNGMYRALSVFVEPLSYGEAAALIAPIGGYFLLHPESTRERLMGALLILCALVSLVVSGARGGSVAFLASMPIVFVLWVFRQQRNYPASIVPPLGGAIAFLATSTIMALVAVWPPLHKMVLGGGETASSDTSRLDQAVLAIPKIIANPFTGYGVGNAAPVIGYTSLGGKLSVDTSILTLLVETGVPGFLFYFGMILTGAYTMARLYAFGKDRESAIGAALASSMIAYGVYRTVLSQRENQWTFFIFLSLICIVLKLVAEKAKKKTSDMAPAEAMSGRVVATAPLRPGSEPGGNWVRT
jgi:O-antigen ligase